MPDSALRAFFFHRRSLVDSSFNSVHAGRRFGVTARLRTGLIAGCVISIGVAVYLGDPSGFMHADPALARLLRGMALIKGMIALAAVAAVLWRLGWPVSTHATSAYLVGTWMLVGSTLLIWQLSWIPAAAILFHSAALAMLFVSWRER